MISLDKWIQTTQEGSFVLYYQNMKEPQEVARTKFLALQHEEQALRATQNLREQTGCSFAELFPLTKRH